MNNTIRAQATFSYKGETHNLGTVIDLDPLLGESDTPPDFHLILAKDNGVDPYSYLYEVLEVQPILFSDPTGLAQPCCVDGAFDWGRFAELWQEGRVLATLRGIAERTLGLRDLDGQPDLKTALLEAYRAGAGGH